MVKRNIGPTDRAIRFVLGLPLFAVFFLLPDSGLRWAVLLIGALTVATAVLAWCALYVLLHISTEDV